jgi:hypothetical protein
MLLEDLKSVIIGLVKKSFKKVIKKINPLIIYNKYWIGSAPSMKIKSSRGK